MTLRDPPEATACVIILEWGLPSSKHTDRGFQVKMHCELVAWGLESELTDHVEDVKSWESDVEVVGSRVKESLGRTA